MSRNKGRGAAYLFLVAHQGDEDGPCLIWPLSRDNHGYGILGYLGKQRKAHKFMCELVHGPRPSERHQASHSCGRGHNGCVHPKHISWKTASQNQLDRKKHGTGHTNHWGKKGKLTAEQMRKVAALKGKVTQQVIADKFGISLPSVRRIQKGKTVIARAALAA